MIGNKKTKQFTSPKQPPKFTKRPSSNLQWRKTVKPPLLFYNPPNKPFSSLASSQENVLQKFITQNIFKRFTINQVTPTLNT